MNYTAEQKLAWDKVVSTLKEHINPYIYKNVFASLEMYSVSTDAIVLLTDSIMQRDNLKQRYYSHLFSLVSQCFGRSYEINIYTREEFEELRGSVEETTLNPRYSFENFVVGPSNNLAYGACVAVAEQPGGAYNPLFIYGSVGLGKTHLMNAIGNYICASDPAKNVLLTTSETFTNELVEALARKDTSALRKKLRNVDVLMVDDVQFLARTKFTQEEFFHTFNDLHRRGKQIIISSDRPPRDIPTIEDRLRSRFEWGLIVDIGKPEYETRVAILNSKAEEMGMLVPYEVIDYVAFNVESNIRELEGILTRLQAQCRLQGHPIDLNMAQEVLGEIFHAQEDRSITPERILNVVSELFGVSVEDLLSKKRTKNIAQARQVAMYLCRKLTSLSTTGIGAAIGGRDHTTVMHGCERVEQDMEADLSFKRKVEELSERVRAGQ